ncbi:methylated-DNA--[protein]-cysteine S-methyltransferase [Paeniglutamicibacter sp. ANT13_2]|uniref:Methylated-DNA--protein-cysteine methyltransferase n=1 Tax=Paeniglutamicibacter terrestris TaxID=2723403 RepID=A0ABX1G0F7_9MICC|nr:methylated-DNA--[protein]-cysteine S-methyltransferase [Paeniglutamicibacter terrestris]
MLVSSSNTPTLILPSVRSLVNDRALRHAIIDSPLGALRLVASPRGISGIFMDNHSHPPAPEVLGELLDSPSDDPLIAQCASELAEYFASERQTFTVATDALGTEFQQRVWAQLATIPYGQSATYGELALALGDEKLTRAVGTANGRNPISIVVPGHRVIGADGSLTGYAGGLKNKEFLLRLEGILPAPEATLF